MTDGFQVVWINLHREETQSSNVQLVAVAECKQKLVDCKLIIPLDIASHLRSVQLYDQDERLILDERVQSPHRLANGVPLENPKNPLGQLDPCQLFLIAECKGDVDVPQAISGAIRGIMRADKVVTSSTDQS